LNKSLKERVVLLAKACASDGNLQREVEELLAAYAEAGTFLLEQAIQVGQELANYKIISLLGRGGWGMVYEADSRGAASG
jgi:hypothetical protein